MRCFPLRCRGRYDPLVSRLANGGRLASSHGGGQRYLLRPDDAGYRLRQLTGCARLTGSGRPGMNRSGGWRAPVTYALQWPFQSDISHSQSPFKSRWGVLALG